MSDKIKQPCVVVLLRRSENEKTPLTVMPHEIEVLKALHGEENIIETEDTPPVEFIEFDPEEEYARLQGLYIGNDKVRDPVLAGLGEYDEFVASFENVTDGDKDALIAQAKELGIKATKNWGIDKIQAAINEALAQ